MGANLFLLLLLLGAIPIRACCHKSSLHKEKESGGKNFPQEVALIAELLVPDC